MGKNPTYTECYLLRLGVSSSSHSRVYDTANPSEMKDNIVLDLTSGFGYVNEIKTLPGQSQEQPCINAPV